MNLKQKLQGMTLDQLYAHKQLLDNSFPSVKNTKSMISGLFIIFIIIFTSLYAMKDNFSYILSGIILWVFYTIIKKVVQNNQIINEIKSRR